MAIDTYPEVVMEYTYITGNVFVARWVIPFVTVPLWDFVMTH